MTCASCGTENEAGRKFCKECGSPLAIACPGCGAANAADAKFCGECGERLGAAPAPGPAVAAPSPVAERRVVSVLFVDLVGSTPLAEGRDAEDTRELLTRYVDLANAIVGRHGGAIEKSIGDAVMAVWGAPTAHEDDAERAVRAGLELVEAVPSLAPGLAARGGVLTGEAAVTIGAIGQGMVAGDLVNTAARLQAAAPTGGVLVGAATQLAAGRAFGFEPAGEQVLKGKATPVPAWLVTGTLGGRGADILEPPFVGRDDELRLLTDLFEATVRERRARLVSVFGPAGIGKSRLAQEFSHTVDALPGGVRWHAGRSPAYGEGVSFWALGEMVRSRCGLREGDDEITTRAAVAATLDHLIDDPAERRWVEGALLTLLGVEQDTGSDQLFAAWRTFFERQAETSPVVLVFEDLQFADSGLIAFIDQLLEWTRGVPLFVLTLARPELLEAYPSWATTRRSFTSLFLDPLGPEPMRALLAGLVPGLPGRAADAIVARADGVPLYAVETVRMLLAGGRLELVDGAYRPADDLHDLAVPDTLTALIASRLDALAPPDRALLSDAAVLGQSFTLDGLASVSGIDARDLGPRLQAFVRRELLRHDADPRSPERGQYLFVQGLIREVAYSTLARRDRVRRHLAAARHLEALGSDELAAALAGHYLSAHANAAEGAEADALATQARVTLKAAADRAAALGAHGQALAFLDQALLVTADQSARADLLERAGEEAASAGERAAAKARFEEAVALHRARDNRVGACRTTAAYVRFLIPRDLDDGAAIVDAAVAEFADLAHTPEGIALRAQEARLRYLQHRNDEAIAVADAVLPAAEAADLLPEIADLLVTRGSTLIVAGRRREGVGAVEAGRRLAEAIDRPYTILRAITNASSAIAQEDPEAALDTVIEGYRLGGRLGLIDEILMFSEITSYHSYSLGRWDAAMERLEGTLAKVGDEHRIHLLGWTSVFEVLRGADPGPLLEEVTALAVGTDDMTEGHVASLQAMVALATGDRQLANVALASEAAKDPGVQRYYNEVAGRLAAWDGDADAAAAALEHIRKDEPRGRWLGALVAGYRANLDALAGNGPDAKAGYWNAIRTLGDLGLVWDAALAGLDMTILMDPGDPAVQAVAAGARATFVDLGALPFVDRLDAALDRDRATARPSTREAAAVEPA